MPVNKLLLVLEQKMSMPDQFGTEIGDRVRNRLIRYWTEKPKLEMPMPMTSYICQDYKDGNLNPKSDSPIVTAIRQSEFVR